MTTPAEAHAFVDAVEKFTGTRPSIAAGIADALAAVSEFVVEQPASLLDLAARGELTAKNAAKVLADAAAPATNTADLKAQATTGLIRRWHSVFRDGSAASEVTDLLAPIWSTAWTALLDARELGIGPDSTADQILDGGAPESLTAWQALSTHRRALDGVLAIVGQLVEFGALPIGDPRHFDSRPRAYATAAFFLDPDALGKHDELVHLLADRGRYNLERAGIWLRLTAVAGVGFHGAAEARSTMAASMGDRAEAERQHHARLHSLDPSDIPYPTVEYRG